jgi:hypothetical protein
VSARIRAGSRFKQFLSFGLIDVRSFRVPPKTSSRINGTRLPQAEDHWFKLPRNPGSISGKGDYTFLHSVQTGSGAHSKRPTQWVLRIKRAGTRSSIQC